MIKHCLGISESRYQSEEFSYLTNAKVLQQQARADIIHSKHKIKEIFDPENSPQSQIHLYLGRVALSALGWYQ